MHSFSNIGYISFNWASARAMNADMVWYSCEHSWVDLTTCYNEICKHWLLVDVQIQNTHNRERQKTNFLICDIHVKKSSDRCIPQPWDRLCGHFSVLKRGNVTFKNILPLKMLKIINLSSTALIFCINRKITWNLTNTRTCIFSGRIRTWSSRTIALTFFLNC